MTKTNQEGKQLVKENELLINGNLTTKTGLIGQLNDWIRTTFIFKNNEVYLPVEKELPIKLDEKLTSLDEYKKSGMQTALKYLITVVFSAGYQAGREVTENEAKPDDTINKLSKEKREEILDICMEGLLADENKMTDTERLIYLKGVNDALHPSRIKNRA